MASTPIAGPAERGRPAACDAKTDGEKSTGSIRPAVGARRGPLPEKPVSAAAKRQVATKPGMGPPSALDRCSVRTGTREQINRPMIGLLA